MASIRTRVSKAGVTTYAVLYNKGGKQTSTTFTDAKSAQKFRDVANAAGVDAALQLLVPTSNHHTVDSLFTDWLERKRPDMTTEAHRDYQRAYAKWIQPTFGWRDAELVTEKDVQAWVEKTLRPNLSPKSVAKQHALLHGMYKWASSKTVGLIANDPCTETRLPKKKKRPPRGLTIPELHAILSAASSAEQRDAAEVVAVLAGTGWRPGEVLGMLAGAVEVMPNGLVYVTQHTAYRRSEGVVDDGKTDASGRRLRVMGEGANILARRIVGLGFNDLVFPHPNPAKKDARRPWAPASFGQEYWPRLTTAAGLDAGYVCKDCDAADLFTSQRATHHRKRHGHTVERGVGRNPTPYWLRHTHVALCHASGMDLAEIQRRIGHESIQTTIDVYGRMIDGMSDESAAKLDALLMPGNVVRGEIV
jgi:site-specific recombinase XerD